jgi:hypothetical protein
MRQAKDPKPEDKLHEDRAYISVKKRFVSIKVTLEDEPPKVQGNSIVLFLHNSGKTPAVNVTIRHAGIFAVERPEVPNFPPTPFMSKTSIAAGDEDPRIAMNFPLIDDMDLLMMKAGEIRLWVVGIIEYDDIYNTHHRTRFCYFLRPPELVELTACADGNMIE